MILDYLFVVPLHLGVAGAALATGLGQCIPSVVGILYFTFARKGLRFTRPEFSKGLLSTSCFNGSSEMVSNLSAAVVTYLFNMLMLKFEGEIGVAAITAILYGQFLFVALYLGYSIGVAPVFSFNYGSRNKQRADPALPHQYPLRCGKLCDHRTCGRLRLSGHFRRFHAERHVRL